MEFHINIFNLLIAFAMLQGFAFSLMLLIRSKLEGPHFYLGLTVFFLSSYLFWVLKYDFGIQSRYPTMQYWPVLFLWGIGPAFFLYLKELFHEPVPTKEKWLMFVPLLIEHLIFNGTTLITYINEFDRHQLNTVEYFLVFQQFSIEHIIGLTSIAYYLIKSYSLLKRNDVMHANNKIRNIMIMFFAMWVVWVPYTLMDVVYYQFTFPPSEFYSFYIVFAGLTYGFGLLGFQISNKTVAQVSLGKEESFHRELTLLAEEFDRLLKEKQLFLNPEMDVKTFAEISGLHPNKVSAVTNQAMNTSFRDYINRYRIKEFKQRARNYDFSKHTILGLAFECGFNSKASFNRAFKKHEEITPIFYINSL